VRYYPQIVFREPRCDNHGGVLHSTQETRRCGMKDGTQRFFRIFSMPVHVIDLKRFELYEVGAALLSVLAYPSDSEETRAAVHASLCHHALRVRCEVEPDWALFPQRMKPIHALRTAREVNHDLRTLQRRLRDRMAAGRMAIGFLKEAVGGRVSELAPGLARVSINQMARLVIEDTGQTDPENVETRIWRPSLPAIHLASAFQVFLQLAEPVMGKIGLETFLLIAVRSNAWFATPNFTHRSSPKADACRSIPPD
jgi:hypothetical protein